MLDHCASSFPFSLQPSWLFLNRLVLLNRCQLPARSKTLKKGANLREQNYGQGIGVLSRIWIVILLCRIHCEYTSVTNLGTQPLPLSDYVGSAVLLKIWQWIAAPPFSSESLAFSPRRLTSGLLFVNRESSGNSNYVVEASPYVYFCASHASIYGGIARKCNGCWSKQVYGDWWRPDRLLKQA